MICNLSDSFDHLQEVYPQPIYAFLFTGRFGPSSKCPGRSFGRHQALLRNHNGVIQKRRSLPALSAPSAEPMCDTYGYLFGSIGIIDIITIKPPRRLLLGNEIPKAAKEMRTASIPNDPRGIARNRAKIRSSVIGAGESQPHQPIARQRLGHNKHCGCRPPVSPLPIASPARRTNYGKSSYLVRVVWTQLG